MKKRTLNRKIKVRGVPHRVGTGWLAPLPDLRDFTVRNSEIKLFERKLGLTTKKEAQKTKVDLREWCSRVEDQQNLGSCTAHAAAGMVEYFEKRAYGKHIEASRLFMYKTARNLMQVTGDTGCWLRDTMGALVLCGVPDEKYWPYNVKDFDKEPGSFVYSVADNYQGVKYFCHDPQGSDLPSEKVLESIKKYLEAGIPTMFGFWGFQSFEDSDRPGDIPFPCEGESAQWGHAVVAVGYDDSRRIKNNKCNSETGGALLIRNSWGVSWGDNGYGWLPYDYVLNRLALDFWSLLEMGWVDSGEFGI